MVKENGPLGSIVITDRDQEPYSTTRRKFVELTAGREAVPPWESKRRFKGYPTLFHALTVASTLKRVGAIVTVARRQDLPSNARSYYSAYRLFETKFKKHQFNPVKFQVQPSSREFPIGAMDIRYTHLYKRDDARSWTQREAAYKTPAHAKQMMMDFMDLHDDEIQIYDGSIKRAAQFPAGHAMYDDSRVNFNQFFTSAANGALGVTTGVNVDAASRSREPGAAAKISVVLGKDGLLNGDELFFMTTIVHEGMHAIDFHRALYLINKWSRSKSRLNFFQWVVRLGDKKKLESIKDLVRVAEHCVLRSETRDYTDAEARQLLPMANFGVNTASTMHLYPHLEGFKLKVWLGALSTIKREFALWEAEMQKPLKQRKYLPTSFAYFSDLDKSDDHYASVAFQSGMQKFADEVAGVIKRVVNSLDPFIARAVKTYVQTAVDFHKQHSKGARGAFLKIVLAKIGP